jgi:hypothetical protein
MRMKRRQSDRSNPARFGRASELEALEARQLLSELGDRFHPFTVYLPTDLAVRNPITHQPLTVTYQELVHDENPQSPLLNNQGKIVTGKDRQGNEWTITVHGPGSVIVTDATPNDGSLDDTINTIQLIGTSINDTYVTGTVTGSAFTPTNSTVEFNKLIATSGVNSIILNGFTLTQTVTPGNAPNNSNTGIFLYGGVRTLEFHNISAPLDSATGDQPINVIIGDPNTPLKVAPSIKIDSIFNSLSNPAATTAPPPVPVTTPTVNITVNGQVHSFDLVSAGQPPVNAGQQFLFPIVATTGRTALRANGVDQLHVRGSAINFTVSRGSVPFQNRLSGVDHIGQATFGANADGVGLDVNGPIGGLRFSRGLGNPTGTSPAATQFGLPANLQGYPATGLVGGLVRATKIGHIRLGPGNTITQTAQNRDFTLNTSTGSLIYYPQPGNALSSAAIVSSGSIGRVSVRGNLQSSEIKSGYDYPSFNNGLEGTRARSTIRPVAFHGDLVSGIVSATHRPFNGAYAVPGNVNGPGKIQGNLGFKNAIYNLGSVTPLLNSGTGFYAKVKRGYLPPPSRPTRIDSVQVR